MTKPICPFIPTSNLIVKRSQITLDLVSKDVEKAVFQNMRKSMESGQVECLTFTFCVSSKVRVYENLKNVFREAMGRQSISSQARNEEPDTVENQSKVPLNLSSKNAKNAFFESMTSHKNENGITSLTFTFTILSIEPTDKELEANFQRESRASEKNSSPSSLATHPGVIFNPLYELVEDPIYEEVDFQKASKKHNPPPIPSLATHPARRAGSNPLYELVTERKNSPGKIRKFLHKCFARKSLPMPQDRHTLHTFDSGFGCNTESKDFKGSLNISCNEDPIYEEIENFRKRKSSKDSGYETIPSPKESITSISSDADCKIPCQVEPVFYSEVLP